ncbi:MAG: hypothetical protein N2654_03710 [Deltaproteobacteria bacterium]|nr:hypothetical protein [Deltaproteobacteria bacterium]
MFPTRFDQPVSKPPLYHWTVCLVSRFFDKQPDIFIARLVSLISLAAGIVFSLLCLNSLNFKSVMSTLLFFPIIDEALDTKVDAFNFFMVWLCVYLYSKIPSFFMAFFLSFLLFFSKGLFSIFSFFFIVLALKRETSLIRTVTLGFVLGLPTLFFGILNVGNTGTKWLVHETFIRFVGDGSINPSPFYYYFQKLLSYLPVNIALIYAAFCHKNLVNKRLFLWSMLFVFILSLSYGKRANYLLPIIPFMSLVCEESFRNLFQKLDLTRRRQTITFFRLTGIALFTLGLLYYFVVSLPLLIDYHRIDVITTVFFNNQLYFFALFQWFLLSRILPMREIFRIFTCFPFLFIILSTGKNIWEYQKKSVDLLVNFTRQNCDVLGVKKNPFDERIDILITLLRENIINSSEYSKANCILAPKDTVIEDHVKIYEEKEIAVFKKK